MILQDEACTVGEDIRDRVIGLDDTVVEFEITSNRPDCLSASSAWPGKPPPPSACRCICHAPVVQGAGRRYQRPAEGGRGRYRALPPLYGGRMVRNVKIAPSPRWLRRAPARLRCAPHQQHRGHHQLCHAGIRPAHARLRSTSYVKDGQIVVRERRGRRDHHHPGRQRAAALTAEMLVIADAEKPIGRSRRHGRRIQRHHRTTPHIIVFESACFNGTSVRLTALEAGHAHRSLRPL